LERQINIGYRQGVKRGYTKLMLQLIKKMFSSKSATKSGKSKKGKDNWAKKQFEEMGKLRGKLILM
jgi:hypothetical protein